MTKNHSCTEIQVQPLQLVAGRDFELVLGLRMQVERLKSQPKYPPIPDDEPE